MYIKRLLSVILLKKYIMTDSGADQLAGKREGGGYSGP